MKFASIEKTVYRNNFEELYAKINLIKDLVENQHDKPGTNTKNRVGGIRITSLFNALSGSSSKDNNQNYPRM